ncbi:hypothetical protein JCM3770_006628 [Rhodotorula araucariae]
MADSFGRLYGSHSAPAHASNPGPSRSRSTTLGHGSPETGPSRLAYGVDALPPSPNGMQTRIVDSLGNAAQRGDVVRVLEVLRDLRTLEMPHLVDYHHSDKNLPALCLAALNPSNLGCRLITQLLLLEGANPLNIEGLPYGFLRPDELHVADWAKWTARRYQAGDREGFQIAAELIRMTPHEAGEYLAAISFTADDLDPPTPSDSPPVSTVAERDGQFDAALRGVPNQPAPPENVTKKRRKRARGKKRNANQLRAKPASEAPDAQGRRSGNGTPRSDNPDRATKRARARPPAVSVPHARAPNRSTSTIAKNWPTSADFIAFDTDSTISLDERPFPPFRPPSAVLPAPCHPAPPGQCHTGSSVAPAARGAWAQDNIDDGDEQPLAPPRAATCVEVDISGDDSTLQVSYKGGEVHEEGQLDTADGDGASVDAGQRAAPPRTLDAMGAETLVEMRSGMRTASPQGRGAPGAAVAAGIAPVAGQSAAYAAQPVLTAGPPSTTPSAASTSQNERDLARMRALGFWEKDVQAVIRVERLKREINAADYDAVLRVLRVYIDGE